MWTILIILAILVIAFLFCPQEIKEVIITSVFAVFIVGFTLLIPILPYIAIIVISALILKGCGII